MACFRRAHCCQVSNKYLRRNVRSPSLIMTRKHTSFKISLAEMFGSSVSDGVTAVQRACVFGPVSSHLACSSDSDIQCVVQILDTHSSRSRSLGSLSPRVDFLSCRATHRHRFAIHHTKGQTADRFQSFSQPIH